jgi:hydrogenase nickel incorporation protein HypA/HybF
MQARSAGVIEHSRKIAAMHEIALISGILEIVESYEKTEGFERVNTLKLSFGRLSCIDPETLRFVFKIQSTGTKAAGASLEFDILPIVVYCSSCDREAPIEQYPSPCPRCLGNSIVLRGGTESLQLLEMDVD